MRTVFAAIFAGFILFILLTPLLSFALSPTQSYAESSTSDGTQHSDCFLPVVWKPSEVDRDNNQIADNLDHEIAQKVMSGEGHDYVNVDVMLMESPKAEDANVFISLNGFLTTVPWTKATYGFGGRIPYDDIKGYASKNHNVLLVEKEEAAKASVAYAAKQVGARTYVWNNLGLQGDPNSSIAVLDSGIDSSHTDFLPGFGDLDFGKKIVGWNDQVDSSLSPIDDNGHGTALAGLAAGAGFFSVDSSGNAVTSWSSNLAGISSGNYLITGMMVNKTGNITLSVKWTSTGTTRLNAIPLYYGDKTITTSSWSKVAEVSTNNANTWYTLTYNVPSTPTGGYDMYHPEVNITSGTGNLYVAFNMSWPFSPPTDGFSAWTGLAPQSKLVGVKVLDSTGSGTTTQIVDGINWIISNRIAYHITIASMSLGLASESSLVDSAVLNLINSGISVIAAAGNDGYGANFISSPGSVDEAITVAAINEFDNIAYYSSQGGASFSGQTAKPDISAPGGSFYGVPIFGPDSNYNEIDGIAEIQANDSTPLTGTSFATAIIAGCTQIVIQAMGGYNAWNWTRNQALQPKMILLMTGTETYPNFREGGNLSSSPTLERGGKDDHEGYGRVNLDAAVDALLKPYQIGDIATDTLGKPPSPTDISVLGQKLVWARNVHLISGNKYSFALNVPAGSDYDLYLYNSTGTSYGEPAIVAKSTSTASGGTEQFLVAAPYTGTYYLVVKRATETTGSGTFILSSSIQPNVTIITPGLLNANNVVHYTQNGEAKIGSIAANKFSDSVDPATTIAIENPIYISSAQRYLTQDQTNFTIQSSTTLTVNFKTQYYLNINSTHTVTATSQWADQGGDLSVSTISPTDIVENDHQWVCTGFSVDGGASQTGYTYTFTNVQAAHTITFNWKEQYYFALNSLYGSPSGGGWYDTGATVRGVLSSGTVSAGTGTQFVFTSWSNDASGTDLQTNGIVMSSAKVAKANWKTQYYLTISSLYGTAGGGGWYDSAVTAFATESATTIAGPMGTQYVFDGWSGDSSGVALSSNQIVMNSPKVAIADWTTQYYLNMSANFGSSIPGGWHDSGSQVVISSAKPVANSGEQYIWNNWTGSGFGSYSGTNSSVSISMNGSITEIATWRHQYQLTVTSDFGSPEPTSGWFDEGSTISASVKSAVVESFFSRQVCIGWEGTGSVPQSGNETHTVFTLNQQSNITWNWKTQYSITLLIPIIFIPALAISIILILWRRRKNLKRKTEKPPRQKIAQPKSRDHLFISHVEEDSNTASKIAQGLEKAGYKTWYYERDNVPGLSYLLQVSEAIEQSVAIVLLISPHSLSSNQVTNEVVRAHEERKPFIPILLGITHVEFQQRQPEWREAIGSASSITLPKQGVNPILPRIISGLENLGIKKNLESTDPKSTGASSKSNP